MHNNAKARHNSAAANKPQASRMLLLTGKPGIGKTTVVLRVAAGLATATVRGFYTEEIREGGVRQGFRLVGFDELNCVIAHVAFSKKKSIGKYGVDVAAIDAAATLLHPDRTADVYLVDEIGRMECLSDRFVDAMRTLVAGDTPVIATVSAGGGGYIAEVKRMAECVLWEVTHTNRDDMPERVLAWFAAIHPRVRPQQEDDRSK
jgi:nucleoside-triphosphatase